MLKQICILTLGCPKNIVDTEFIMSSLDKQKFIFTEIVENADIILLNTCGFLQTSIEESFSYIQALQNLKSKKTNLKLIVFGCLVSRFANTQTNFTNSKIPNSKFLKKNFPLIDNFFPVFSVAQIVEFLNSNYSKVRTDLLASKHYAYLKISDGCNRKCAFCTIPNIKGKYKSETQNNLLEDAKTLVNNGVKELILIGQETTNYGIDVTGNNATVSKNNITMNENNATVEAEMNFYNLLAKLSEVEKLQWLRIMYAHPNSFDERILELMNDRKNICKYIDIPLQHISNNVLQAMQRGTPSNKIKLLLEKMRKIVPEIRIRSTFIVGFPNETEKDFQELYNFLNEFELDRVGIFKYSAEIGTVGFESKKQINDGIKEERFAKLMELQQAISLKKNKKLVGKKLDILVETDFDDIFFAGRTEFDAPEIDNGVLVKKATNSQKPRKIKLGEIQTLTVVDCTEYDLICE